MFRHIYDQLLYLVLVWKLLSVYGLSIYSPDSTNTTKTLLSEGATEGTLVYTVSGSSTLTFNKISQSPASPSFNLNSASGELTAPSGLDAETVLEFILIFSGTDGTDTITSGTLTVEIDNINDNAPTFDVSSFTTTILDSASNGFVVTTANVTDLDVSFYHTFSIIAGDTGSTFTIGPTTGIVTLQTASNLNAVVSPTYTLTVQVSDSTYTDTMTVNINVQVDLCSVNPCQNSGSCTNSGGSYLCTCSVGYIGTNCTDVDPCWPQPCLNSGNCSINGTSYACTCLEGWIDENCSSDDPCLPNPCNNSGTCSVIGTSYLCACAAGFSGVNCTDTDADEDTDSPSEDNTVIIIVVVVLVGVMLAVLFNIVIVYAIKTKSLCFKANIKGDEREKTYRRRSSSKATVAPNNNTFIDKVYISK